MPDGGDVLVKPSGVLSLNSLGNVVTEALDSKRVLSDDMSEDSSIPDRAEKKWSWQQSTSERTKSALGEVQYEKVEGNSFVKLLVAGNAIIVNNNPPFVTKHSRCKVEKELLRTSLIDFAASMRLVAG